MLITLIKKTKPLSTKLVSLHDSTKIVVSEVSHALFLHPLNFL